MKAILNIKQNPHGLLLYTATVFLIVFVFPPVATLDFENRTMFSLPSTVVAWIIPLLLLFFWCLYLLSARILYSTTITWIHVLITISVTILIVIFLYIGMSASQSTIGRPEIIGNAMQTLIIVFVCGQFLYLANVLVGLFGRQKVH